MDVKSQRYFSQEWPFAARSPSTTSSSLSGYSSSGRRPSTFTALSASPPSSSVRFPLESSASLLQQRGKKHYCTCSPSTKPGSFRCSLHRSSGDQKPPLLASSDQSLNIRRWVMINNLLRLRKSGVDEQGCMISMRVLAVQFGKLMLSSSNKPRRRRRSDFKQRPTRFRVAFMKEQGIMEEEITSSDIVK